MTIYRVTWEIKGMKDLVQRIAFFSTIESAEEFNLHLQKSAQSLGLSLIFLSEILSVPLDTGVSTEFVSVASSAPTAPMGIARRAYFEQHRQS